jgi:hypothetical protein
VLRCVSCRSWSRAHISFPFHPQVSVSLDDPALNDRRPKRASAASAEGAQPAAAGEGAEAGATASAERGLSKKEQKKERMRAKEQAKQEAKERLKEVVTAAAITRKETAAAATLATAAAKAAKAAAKAEKAAVKAAGRASGRASERAGEDNGEARKAGLKRAGRPLPTAVRPLALRRGPGGRPGGSAGSVTRQRAANSAHLPKLAHDVELPKPQTGRRRRRA